MRASSSYRLSLVVVLMGAFGTIGGDVSSVGSEAQNVKQLPVFVAAVDGSAFAQTTYEQMAAFDRANPDPPQQTIPRMPVPPPQVADAPVATAGIPPTALQPREREPAFLRPWEVEIQQEPLGTTAAPPLTRNFAGTMDNGTTIPPDTHGAVGPNHVAEMLNTGFQVFDRSGAVVLPQITLQAFWSALGTAPGQPASRLTDPRIAFDQYADRWVTVTDGNPRRSDGTNNAWMLVGISDSNDPTGTWNLYAIRANIAVTHPNDWADYTSLGLDPNNVVVTSRIFTQAGAFVHADAWVVNKATLIAGPGPLVQGVDYTVIHNPCGVGGFQFSPCHTFGQTPGTGVNYLLNDGWLDSGTRTRRFMAVYAINGTGAAATLACGAGGDLFVELAQYNFNLLSSPQLSCATPIENGSNSLQNAVWRNGRIWTTHAVGSGSGITDAAPPSKAEVAWYQINPAAVSPFPGGVPDQQGRVVHATQHYSYPSIAVNSDECAALGFSGSDAATFASGYYTLRLSTDPPGTMQPVALLKSGVEPYRKEFGGGRNRWGDYSATCVDPLNDLTFWTVQEYAEAQFPPGGATCAVDRGKWGTWWGAFDCSDVSPPFSAGLPNRNRHLGLSAAAATAGPGPTTALRVTLVDLQNPVPANLPQFPPPNFGCWEAGAACGTVIPAAPPVAACTGTGEAVPPNAQAQGGCARWVGKPGSFLEAQDIPLGATNLTARLQCTPYYQDWTTEGVFYITGAEIAPSSIYDVQAYAASCAGMEGSCLDVSPPLRLTTARSGDVEAPFNPPSTTTQPDVTDVAQLVNKFKNLPGALVKAITQLQPNLPELNADINALDILAVVDALKQKAYAFSGPCPCPSLMTCGSLAPPAGTPCATDTMCIALPAANGGGPGALCVKTCVGGTNDGVPCINDTHGHCPDGGVCGNGGPTPGFCRDRCGRCTPP